ncbi:unnamed protein product [Leuciscus chuanchicus]
MAYQISVGIQPAFPRVSTEWLIFVNAKNWLNTGLDILSGHHERALQEAGLQEAGQAVSHASRGRWREAWEITVKWARRGLKTLRESTVRRAFSEVTRLLTREEGDDGGETSGYVPRESCSGPSSSSSGRQARAEEEEARESQVVVEAVRVRKKTARKPAIKWPQPTVEKPSTQGSYVPKPKRAVENRPARGESTGPGKRAPANCGEAIRPGVFRSHAKNSHGESTSPGEEDPPQRASDLGDSLGYNLEVEQEQVCLKVEPLKPGKAKKGLGPCRSRAVGVLPVVPVLPVLPSLTPIQHPEEPMEVGDSLDSDVEWLLEASQVAVPQESGPGAAGEAIMRRVPVVPQEEETVVVRKVPGVDRKKVPESPAARNASARKSHHVKHEVVGGDKYSSWGLAPGRAILIIGDSNLSRVPEINNGAVELPQGHSGTGL